MRQLLPLALLPLTLTACDLPATRIVEMPATYFSKLSGIDDATGLHIDNGTGSVHLIQGGPEIEGTLVLYGEHTEVQVHIVDGVVVFDAECSDLVCAVDFDLRVPEGWSVTVDNPTGSVRVESLAPSWLVVDTGSGTIDVTDVTADAVDLDSGSGAITLADVSSNALALDTGSGGLNGSAIRTEDLRAETGAGAVSLEVLTSPQHIGVSTGSGGVRVTLPRGAYDLSLTTGSGGVNVDQIEHDPESGLRVEISTGTGGIQLGAS